MNPQLASPFWVTAREIALQAGPVVLARASVMALALVDTVMVGRYSPEELASLGLALALTTPLLLVGIGLLMGTLVLTAATFGAGEDAACGRIWQRSLAYAVILGLIMAGVSLFAEPILLAFGQSATMTERARPVAQVLGLGMGAQLVFITTQYFLEGVRRPVPGMVLMLLANVVNAGLDLVLVYGYSGLSPLGALGSAWATTLVRFFLAAAGVLYVATMADRRRFFPASFARSALDHGGSRARLQRHLGYASGVSIGLEGIAFNGLGFIAGTLGPLPLAAFTIGFNALGLIFMVAVGLGAATAVQVGAATGRDDAAGAARAGWTGLCLSLVVFVTLAVALDASAPVFAGLYATDETLRRLAIPILAFLAFVVVVDGTQGVMVNALRGRGDTWGATAIHAFSFLMVMLPTGWGLAVLAERGVMGLFQAMFIGSSVAVVALVGRFWALTRDGGANWPRPSLPLGRACD